MDYRNVTLPDDVLDGAQFVCDNARYVRIDQTQLAAVAERITARLEKGIDSVEESFGSAGSLERDANMVFFETAVNFYFWAADDAHKWKIDINGKPTGGWYGLAGSFARAVKAGLPVYDATWMSELTPERARELFAGEGSQIPLLEQRVNNIVEAAQLLLRKYDGSVLNFVAAGEYSAPKISELTVRELPSFRDGCWYEGRWVWFLKRAQILASDLQQLSAKYPDFVITDTDKLTAFADYRLPQLLRHFGVLVYDSELADVVDDMRILPSGSPQEAELRAATIIAFERMKQFAPDIPAARLDLGLWLISQDVRGDKNLKPHHRTPTYFY